MEESRSSISSEIQQWSNAKIALLIFIAGLILFTAGLSVYRFDESSIRYAKYCMEMKDHPIGCFPYLNGTPDHNMLIPYPLLAYWSSQIFGGKINMFTISLPSSICGALSLMFIYLIGAREKREIGLYAVLFTIGSYYFISLARTPCPSMFVICASLLGYFVMTKTPKRWWTWFTFLPISAIGFVFGGFPGFIFAMYAIVPEFLKKKSVLQRYFEVILRIAGISFFCFFLYISNLKSPHMLYISLSPDKLFILITLSCIPFATLILGTIFSNEKHIRLVDKYKENFFYVIRFVPFTLMLCWWVISYRLQQDKSLSPLPVMIPSMILLVCGMGMFAAKELKANSRQLVMTAALVMSIYTTKIMIIDPISMAFADKQPGITQNVR